MSIDDEGVEAAVADDMDVDALRTEIGSVENRLGVGANECLGLRVADRPAASAVVAVTREMTRPLTAAQRRRRQAKELITRAGAGIISFDGTGLPVCCDGLDVGDWSQALPADDRWPIVRLNGRNYTHV